MKPLDRSTFWLLSFGIHAIAIVIAALVAVEIGGTEDERDIVFLVAPRVRWGRFTAEDLPIGTNKKSDAVTNLWSELEFGDCEPYIGWSYSIQADQLYIQNAEITCWINVAPHNPELDSFFSDPKFRFNQENMTDLNSIVESGANLFTGIILAQRTRNCCGCCIRKPCRCNTPRSSCCCHDTVDSFWHFER